MKNFQQFPNKTNSNDSGSTLSSWSRQQKIAMISGFTILGILIAAERVLEAIPEPALVGISSPNTNFNVCRNPGPPTNPQVNARQRKNEKETHKKGPLRS